MKPTIYASILFFSITLLLNACTSSLITSSWIATPLARQQVKSVIVVAVLPDDDHHMRAQMENHLVGDLNTLGIRAISSYKRFGPKFGDNMNEHDMMNQLASENTDAILTIVLLNKEKEKYYVPGRVYYTPYYIRHRRFWGYYSTMYERVYEPGYYLEKTNFFWESNLFLMSTKEILYSSQTKSFDPINIESMAHEYGKMICSDLKGKGLFIKQ